AASPRAAQHPLALGDALPGGHRGRRPHRPHPTARALLPLAAPRPHRRRLFRPRDGGLTMILAGDIGGTKTHLAFCEVDGPRVRPLVLETFPSQEHGSLDEIVSAFVAAHRVTVTRAAFGIAG